jgi:hypothetical protein
MMVKMNFLKEGLKCFSKKKMQKILSSEKGSSSIIFGIVIMAIFVLAAVGSSTVLTTWFNGIVTQVTTFIENQFTAAFS